MEDLHDQFVIQPNQLQGCDRDKLDSCLHRLVNRVNYEGVVDIHEAAAVVIESVAMSHAFADGNKRTSLLAMIAFYVSNRKGLPPDLTSINIAKNIEDLVDHKLSVDELASSLRSLRTLTEKKLKRLSRQPRKPEKYRGLVRNTRKGRKSKW